MSKEVEVRHLQVDEIRDSSDDDSIVLEGYVARYNQIGSVGSFHEEIDARAFDSSLESDNNVFALYNHDWSKPIASTKNNTLELIKAEDGLRFKITPKANTSFIRDVQELVKSGEVSGMSFGFTANKDKWSRRDGKDVRTLLDINLKEITITPIPFYESSEVAMRSHDEFMKQEQRNQDELELLQIELDLMKLKNNL